MIWVSREGSDIFNSLVFVIVVERIPPRLKNMR